MFSIRAFYLTTINEFFPFWGYNFWWISHIAFVNNSRKLRFNNITTRSEIPINIWSQKINFSCLIQILHVWLLKRLDSSIPIRFVPHRSEIWNIVSETLLIKTMRHFRGLHLFTHGKYQIVNNQMKCSLSFCITRVSMVDCVK